jgi:hypothetical protein
MFFILEDSLVFNRLGRYQALVEAVRSTAPSDVASQQWLEVLSRSAWKANACIVEQSPVDRITQDSEVCRLKRRNMTHVYGCAIYRLAGCIRRILYTLAYIYGFSVCNVYLDARFSIL